MSHAMLHQFLVSDLVVPVGLAQEPGQECLTRFGARLGDATRLAPDLIVFRKEQVEGDLPCIAGAPVLAVEVVSPVSRAADLGAKRDLYARAGVPAYWVVDADDAAEPELVVHALSADGRYAAERVPWGGSLRLTRPFAIDLAPQEIFRPPRRVTPRRRAAMPDVIAQENGPDLPPAGEPVLLDVFDRRWPTGAEKTELWDGCPVFYGIWDERDVRAAQSVYPGRVVRLDQAPGEPGTMTVLPAPEPAPQAAGGTDAAT
ncbi:Uma2 family endonuclease [Actinomadura litoris]|uniref:Putative restriction endonuclease domain-containing protein n=1 Tax=Actinomadura litoris TaxID=2678616 RepID=A0A7K1L6T3_9ACTN|nr:Uma2 family endonuclease [Actinomadura litoris]MUN40137.1 hypothetical protein [Actinomadura litoris]